MSGCKNDNSPFIFICLLYLVIYAYFYLFKLKIQEIMSKMNDN